MQEYNYQTDLQLEQLIMQKYGLTNKERNMISEELNCLPNLSAVKNMKMEA